MIPRGKVSYAANAAGGKILAHLKAGNGLEMESAASLAKVTEYTAYQILMELEKSGGAHVSDWNGKGSTKRATFRIGQGPLGADKYGRSIRPPKPKKKKERKAGVMSDSFSALKSAAEEAIRNGVCWYVRSGEKLADASDHRLEASGWVNYKAIKALASTYSE